MRMTTRLRMLISGQNVPYGAAAYDGLTAKLVCEAGFDVVTAAGFQIAASLGLPDAELYTMTENLQATRRIVASSSVPVIADCDTGYGNAINVMRTVREFEQIGVAGILLEDQVTPKRCPAMADPEILSLEEGVGKIRAAISARADPDLVIIGRTDATDIDEACRRVRAYAAAGADMVFTINRCSKTYDDLLRIREAAGVPLQLHLMGWVEDLTPQQIRAVAGCAGFGFATLLTVTEALRRNLSAIQRTKSTKSLPVETTALLDFKTFIGFPEIEAMQREYIPR
jgi:2-methylisocitrate lyase-like PEP mutase family enzyme